MEHIIFYAFFGRQPFPANGCSPRSKPQDPKGPLTTLFCAGLQFCLPQLPLIGTQNHFPIEPLGQLRLFSCAATPMLLRSLLTAIKPGAGSSLYTCVAGS